jgi:hypothetical protein
MAHPSGGMYGIRIVGPGHLTLPFFRDGFDGTDGRFTLMNFSDKGKSPTIAENIPVGHRSFIYQTKPLQRFTHAFEYIGGLAQGLQAFSAHRVAPESLTGIDPKWFKVLLPIRYLARIDPENWQESPTTDELFQLTRFVFRPVGFPMQYISAEEYNAIFSAIEWDWMAADVRDADPPNQ